MSGGIAFPNPANPGGQPNLNDLLNRKKSAANKGGIFGGIANSGGGFLSATPKQQAGSLAEAIEKQAAVQKAQAAQSSGSTSTDPFAMLQQQLYGAANSINVAATPLEQLQKMAQQQVSAQFDPQIQALMAETATHANRAKKSESTARKMYGALAQDFMSQLPELTNQFKAEDAATNQRYDQAQQQMNQEYDTQAANQDAVLKRLGVQAASQDASQQASDDQKYFQSQGNLDQQNALSALQQQQQAQSDYTQNLGNTSKMAGENTAQDIASQLSDYMTQSDSQLNSLQSQKGAAIAALLSQMQGQDQSRVQTQSQQQFDNMMKLFNFQLAAQKAGQSANGGSSAGGFGTGTGAGSLTSGLPGAQNYLASQYPDQPILASHLMQQLNDVLSNKEITQGKFQLTPGDPSMGKAPTYSKVGQQYIEDLLRHQFEQQGGRYSTGDINATMAALEAYLGKLH